MKIPQSFELPYLRTKENRSGIGMQAEDGGMDIYAWLRHRLRRTFLSITSVTWNLLIWTGLLHIQINFMYRNHD